ncbi:thiamine transporter 1-like [Daktulosphaira vitifoliae]|uniref:thiamine transporter 1-like n=1 Tax=Daktulosphaira vitifoliae TaxID=58002 RepID=UPI0021AAFDAA|nr:thiamine transporter 1-like [Daktulosphaira vitifoliae]
METQNNWKYMAFLVCVFAVIREIRPIEPFFTSFLVNSGFTLEQVNEKIYAVGTYSCLALALVILLVTDYFRYKPLIVADGIAGVFTYALLLGSPSIERVRVEQIFFGFFYSSEVAFATYLYAKVNDKQYYQKITSLVKASTLFGRSLSGLIAQIIVSMHILSYHHLLYISIFCTSFVTIWALFLPRVTTSVYFHRNNTVDNAPKDLRIANDKTPIKIFIASIQNDEKKIKKTATLNEVRIMLFNDFKSAFKNNYVAKLCFWWILSLSGYLIVATYMQVLWEDVAKENNSTQDLMNGAVESVHTLCGAAGAYAVGHVQYEWKKRDNILFAIGSSIMALLLYTLYYSHKLLILYVFYVLYGVSYQIILTVTTAEVAKCIKPDSYGLIFGFNLFMSLLIISIFTLIFIQGVIFVVGTRNQILTIASLHTIIGVLFFIMAVKKLFKKTES